MSAHSSSPPSKRRAGVRSCFNLSTLRQVVQGSGDIRNLFRAEPPDGVGRSFDVPRIMSPFIDRMDSHGKLRMCRVAEVDDWRMALRLFETQVKPAGMRVIYTSAMQGGKGADGSKLYSKKRLACQCFGKPLGDGRPADAMDSKVSVSVKTNCPVSVWLVNIREPRGFIENGVHTTIEPGIYVQRISDSGHNHTLECNPAVPATLRPGRRAPEDRDRPPRKVEQQHNHHPRSHLPYDQPFHGTNFRPLHVADEEAYYQAIDSSNRISFDDAHEEPYHAPRRRLPYDEPMYPPRRRSPYEEPIHAPRRRPPCDEPSIAEERERQMNPLWHLTTVAAGLGLHRRFSLQNHNSHSLQTHSHSHSHSLSHSRRHWEEPEPEMPRRRAEHEAGHVIDWYGR